MQSEKVFILKTRTKSRREAKLALSLIRLRHHRANSHFLNFSSIKPEVQRDDNIPDKKSRQHPPRTLFYALDLQVSDNLLQTEKTDCQSAESTKWVTPRLKLLPGDSLKSDALSLFNQKEVLMTESWLLSSRSLTTSVYVAFMGKSHQRLIPRQALIDGPATDSKSAVPRQAIALSQCVLTPLVIDKLPRAAGTGALKAAWEKAGIEAKWQESTWAKKRAQKERRAALTDFERFKVMRLRKQARFEVRKSLAKIRSAA